jgi:hypothetical protein
MSRRVHREYDKGLAQTFIEYLLDTEEDKLSSNDRSFLENYKAWERTNSETVKELDRYIDTIVVLVRDYTSSDGKVTYPLGLRLHIVLQVFGQLLGFPLYVYRGKLVAYACNSKRIPLLLRPDYFVVDRGGYRWK